MKNVKFRVIPRKRRIPRRYRGSNSAAKTQIPRVGSKIPRPAETVGPSHYQRRQSWGLGVGTPDFGQCVVGSQGVVDGSWTGREILGLLYICLNLIMYRKYDVQTSKVMAFEEK